MSGVAGFATIFATTQALMGQTWAGDEVLMAPGGTIDEVVTKPTICIYGGEGHSDIDVDSGDTANASPLTRSERMIMRFEMFAPSQFQLVNANSTFTFDSAVAPDAFASMMWRQVLKVLLFDLSPWAAIWRDMVRIGRIQFQSVLWEFKNAERVPARVVNMELDLISEPAFGEQQPRGEVWDRFLTTLAAAEAAQTVDVGFAAILREAIEGPDNALRWQVEMAKMGVSAQTQRNLGLGTLDDTTIHELVGQQEATVLASDNDTIVIDADGAG